MPLCEIEDDTTEHVLKRGRGTDRKQRTIKNNTEEEWEEVVQIFRKKLKKKRRKKRDGLGRETSLDTVVLYSRGQWTFSR